MAQAVGELQMISGYRVALGRLCEFSAPWISHSTPQPEVLAAESRVRGLTSFSLFWTRLPSSLIWCFLVAVFWRDPPLPFNLKYFLFLDSRAVAYSAISYIEDGTWALLVALLRSFPALLYLRDWGHKLHTAFKMQAPHRLQGNVLCCTANSFSNNCFPFWPLLSTSAYVSIICLSWPQGLSTRVVLVNSLYFWNLDSFVLLCIFFMLIYIEFPLA